MDPDAPTNTEAELESFRRKWREEVTARAKGKAPAPKTTAPSSKPRGAAPDPALSSHARRRSVDDVDQAAPHVYHDLGEKHHGSRLAETTVQSAAAAAAALEPGHEPSSALEHYEKAVEKEAQGSLGDSVNLYRKAFRLDSKVHETYKAKHFPPSYFKAKAKTPAPALDAAIAASSSQVAVIKAQDTNPPSAPTYTTTVPPIAFDSLPGLSAAVQTLIRECATTSILGEPAPTDLSPSPPCPISALPEEILVEILEHLVSKDITTFIRLAQVCKRLAYLVATEDRVWKRLVLGREYGFADMHYTWACQVDGRPLGDDEQGGITLGLSDLDLSDTEESDYTSESTSPTTLTQLLVPTNYPTYRTLFQRRPRVRFNGCYISTVNYMRPGQSSPTSLTWNSPIHIVTYYRYLRFLRDGTCISLLTTSEPADVVPFLYVEHMHKGHGSLPTAPMKDALLGRWRLTGPNAPEPAEQGEEEGTLVVETAGVTPKYLYKMALGVGNAGRGSRNNKLSWQGYWSYNRLTDDWAEFGLKNDKAFYWSRVKSYAMSWDESGMRSSK